MLNLSILYLKNSNYSKYILIIVVIIIQAIMDSYLHNQYEVVGLLLTTVVFVYLGAIYFIYRNIFLNVILHSSCNAIAILDILYI